MLTYCSFATEQEFLGAVVLSGRLDPMSAALECHASELNPGGTMMCAHIAEDYPQYAWLQANSHRLLTREELVANTAAVRLGDALDEETIASIGIEPTESKL